MALETGTFISDLVATNPTGSDALAFADDHLRLIKSTVKATFPNISGAVTVTHTDLNSKVPNAVQKDGSVAMTGALTLSGAPTVDLHAATKAYVDAAITAARQSAYPVGSIYTNASVATNPATLLGFGTWASFGAGRVPVGFNAADPIFDTAEETGGSKDAIVVSHTHTASTAEAGSHNHSGYVLTSLASSGSVEEARGSPDWQISEVSSAGAHTHSVTVNSTGSSGTNANLPPYITVYMWKRTA